VTFLKRRKLTRLCAHSHEEDQDIYHNLTTPGRQIIRGLPQTPVIILLQTRIWQEHNSDPVPAVVSCNIFTAGKQPGPISLPIDSQLTGNSVLQCRAQVVKCLLRVITCSFPL
jgi:hypothetical protein